MSAANEITAREALAALASGSLTAEALTRACLDRIALREPTVHAFAHLDPGRAIEEARLRDRAPGRGPLHGLPIAVKDIIDTHDMPTQCGSPICEGFRPRADAACVALAREAGLKIEERLFTLEEAYDAAEAFLTSASNFVLPIVSIDGRPVGTGKPGALTRRLRELYLEMARGTLAAA